MGIFKDTRIHELEQTHINDEKTVLKTDIVQEDNITAIPIAFRESVRDGEGRYEVQGLLGAQTYNQIYYGFDHKLDKEVAIRVVSQPDLQNALPLQEIDNLPLALQIATILSSFNHPNIIKVYNYSVFGKEKSVIVEELLKGETLYALEYKNAGLKLEEIVQIYADAGKGLDELHKHGIVHREFTREHLMIEGFRTDHQRAVIFDFDSARKLSDKTQRETRRRVNSSPYTLSSSSQEPKELNKSTDHWALLTTIFQSISGNDPYKPIYKIPFKEEDFDFQSIYKLSEDRNLIEKYGPEKGKALDAFFQDNFTKYKEINNCEEVTNRLNEIA